MPSWEEFENLVKSVNTNEEFDNLKMGADFAAKIIKARLDRNLTQAELAARAGLTIRNRQDRKSGKFTTNRHNS
jgi:ribosome-binding protein aMBF1 (putative translation factor)